MHMNGYRCIACAESQAIDFAEFLCPSCGGNLEIIYDYAAIAKVVAAGFADGRADLFRYAPLLPVKEIDAPFPLRVGGTPRKREGHRARNVHRTSRDDSEERR